LQYQAPSFGEFGDVDKAAMNETLALSKAYVDVGVTQKAHNRAKFV
jgi:hypothetical protein